MGIVNHAELKGTTTPKRIDVWANSQPVGMAIERLGEVFRQGINEKMLFIRYEDLCLYPEATMLKIFGAPIGHLLPREDSLPDYNILVLGKRHWVMPTIKSMSVQFVH